MGRNPSIHVLETDLIIILGKVIPLPMVNKLPAKFKDHKELALEIITQAKNLSIASRKITITNNKLEHKINKLKLANRSDTAKFAQLLLYTRRKLKHRGIRLIQPGEADWLNIKEICKLATEFCNEFSINIKDGYSIYISMGLSMMKTFSLFKFKSVHSSICTRYEALLTINGDKFPEKTKEGHDFYLAMISEKIGYSQGYENFPEKYLYFVEARENAKKFGISIKQYIKAQFDGFNWRNGIPDPAQLVGVKAIDRLQKWAFENSVNLGNKSTGVDFKKIKKTGW